ncbi:ABC transporter substrate-binding protein [Brevibacillus fluminis]|uniref:ABC transporter substrate-binding protein n=1 Tax=Brevibacillus fluminis TaxID=511487 RepID=UPI003F8A439D
MRKKQALWGLLLTSLLVTAGCGNAAQPNNAAPAAANTGQSAQPSAEAPKQELAKELKLFAWGEYFPQEVLDDFTNETGVKVIYDKYTSNGEMLTKLKSGAVDYDLVVPTDYIVERMAKQNMLQELDMKNIPNFANIADVFHERSFDPGNKYSVPMYYGSIGLAYDKTKADNPTGWKDLWNPKYKGHVIISEVGREALLVALQKNGKSMNSTEPADLEAAKNDLIALAPNVLAYNSTPSDVLAVGDAWIAAVYSGEAAKAMKTNKNLNYVMPQEGGTLWMDNLAIPTGAKNKYTAEVFINYILRPDVSKRLTDVYPYSNPNKEAVKLMSDAEKNNPASYPPEDSLKKAEWFADLGPKLKEMDRVWKEVRGQ